MELDKFHVDQFCARVIGERVAVASVFPTIARDFVGAADATGREDDRFGAENLEPSALAFIAESADDAVAIFQQGKNRMFHVDIDSLMNPVILKRPDRNSFAESGRPLSDQKLRPKLQAPGHGPALPWRAVRPCASC